MVDSRMVEMYMYREHDEDDGMTTEINELRFVRDSKWPK